MIKLKRKLNFRGHVYFEAISPDSVYTGTDTFCQNTEKFSKKWGECYTFRYFQVQKIALGRYSLSKTDSNHSRAKHSNSTATFKSTSVSA